MDHLYSIKTFLDKVLLLEAAEGERKAEIANMWYIGMLDVMYVESDNAKGQKTPMLLFSLRKYHPLSMLFKRRLQDTYFLSLPHLNDICADSNGKVTLNCQ